MALTADLLLVCSQTEADRVLQPALEAALRVVLPLAQALDSTDTGVVFMFSRVGDTQHKPLVVLHGGHVPPDKRDWYTDNATRKLNAFDTNPALVSTAEVADESIELYGGGLKFGGRIVYISAGLNPHFDELLVCMVAWGLGQTTIEEMRRLATISNNAHLFDAIRQLETALRR